MPIATISTDCKKFPLNTVEGGEVKLRRMPYGKWLHRQEMALQMRLSAGRGKDTTGTLDMANRKVTEFEFAECIVEHNLTDDAGSPLDFTKSHTFDLLDPRVGNEIGSYIMEMHEFETSLPNS